MLKLERINNSEKIQIRVKEKRSFFDRRLRQAFTYSLLFHVVVFGVFRVKFLQVHESAQVFLPVEVALDPESIEESGQGVIAEVQDEVERTAPFSTNTMQFPERLCNYQEAADLMFTQKRVPLEKIQDDHEFLEPLSKESVNFPEHIYPLKINLSRSLSKLKIVEDGLNLFKIKNKKFNSSHLLLATTTFPISYTVNISGATGKIIHWDRKQELIDKKLQECADLILQKITFTTFPQESLKGQLQLIFTCNGDEIRGFLQ